MVTKYVILANSSVDFDTPRQLSVINGERLLDRTVRLLKQNGITDILISSCDKRFDDVDAIRYEPKYNNYDPIKKTGYWLDAFPIELLDQPITFLFGDVYYSENAIKKIVEIKTDSILFFCSYQNTNKNFIKKHDEPFAFKVVDYIKFKEHIDRVKKLKDQGKCCREPINWELYRSLNGIDINTHKLTNNYIIINDESCDIDEEYDIILMRMKIEGGNNMIKCEVIKEFTLGDFDKLQNIVRKNQEEKGRLFVGDVFECTKDLADYLLGDNSANEVVIKVLEIKPEEEKNVDITETTFELRKPTIENLKESKSKAKKTIKKKTVKKTVEK